MKRIIIFGAVVMLVAAAFVVAQQRRASTPEQAYPAYEVLSMFPRETSPAMYQQVSEQELESLAAQGWELVSVVPYVFRNEERGGAATNRPAVTQAYPAYFFKRPKAQENGKAK